MVEVVIEKMVHGGQGLGTLPDGRRVFVWGALPGERVTIDVLKGKKSYAEAVTVDIIERSPVRAEPREKNYLATSPWQIVQFSAENEYKKGIVGELFSQAHVSIPDFRMTAAGEEWRYRNKMEYSFWGDDDGLHLALFNRGTHQKTIVHGSELALPAVDAGARALVVELRKSTPRAGDLKSVVVRCNQRGDTVAALFVKLETFRKITLPPEIKGLRVYYSNPKSPASVPTRLLYELGEATLSDELLGRQFIYDVDSFFQVNIPIFSETLARIREHCDASEIVDMYAGVGTIGLSVATKKVELVELDTASAAMARVNASTSTLEATVIETSSEKALDAITAASPIIFDPPRAGLHDHIVNHVLEVLPPKIIYLSCNPATQARDLAKLQDAYSIDYFEAFNFFPHTPHIETLAVLIRKSA